METTDDIKKAKLQRRPLKVFTDKLSNAQYHKLAEWDIFSSTQLKYFHFNSPAHFKWMYLDFKAPVKKSEAMTLGSAVHTLFLEPENFQKEFAVAPMVDRRTKIGKEAWREFESENDGKEILSREMHDRARLMAMNLSSLGIEKPEYIERSVIWTENDLDYRCRPDAFGDGVLWEVKTTRNLNPRAFSRDVFTLGYDISLAHYCLGLEKVLNWQFDEINFLVVESQPPYMAMVYKVPLDVLLIGKHKLDELTRRFEFCMEHGEWPGYEGYLEIPAWEMLKESDDGICQSSQVTDQTENQFEWDRG